MFVDQASVWMRRCYILKRQKAALVQRLVICTLSLSSRRRNWIWRSKPTTRSGEFSVTRGFQMSHSTISKHLMLAGLAGDTCSGIGLSEGRCAPRQRISPTFAYTDVNISFNYTAWTDQPTAACNHCVGPWPWENISAILRVLFWRQIRQIVFMLIVIF